MSGEMHLGEQFPMYTISLGSLVLKVPMLTLSLPQEITLTKEGQRMINTKTAFHLEKGKQRTRELPVHISDEILLNRNFTKFLPLLWDKFLYYTRVYFWSIALSDSLSWPFRLSSWFTTFCARQRGHYGSAQLLLFTLLYSFKVKG